MTWIKTAGKRAADISAAAKSSALQQKLTGWLLIAIAIALRARQFFFNRSLWGDEAALALNIVNRHVGGLFKPLGNGQSAPLGFLFAEKMAITLFGNHDYVLRLIPFAAGVAAVFVMAWLIKRIFPGWTGLLALGLFTFSWPSIYYASEVKQYSSDVLFSLILLSAASFCTAPEVPRRNWLWLLAAGTLALWMSHPSLFLIAGIGIVLAVTNLLDRKWPNLIWLLISSFFWLANFFCIYILVLRQTAANKMLHDFWLKAFMPLPPWKDWDWFSRSGQMIFKELLTVPIVLGLVVLAIGIFYAFRRDLKTAVQWSIPILVALAASGLGKYPFWTRFLLFLLPMLCFFLATGIGTLHGLASKFLPRTAFVPTVIIVIMVFWHPAALSVKKFKFPVNKNDIKPLMAYWRANRQRGDIIYVHHAKFQFMYYTDGSDMNYRKAIFEARVKNSISPLMKNMNKISGCPRVWFLFTNQLFDSAYTEKAMLEYLDRIGFQEEQFRATGATLYLYDLSRQD